MVWSKKNSPDYVLPQKENILAWGSLGVILWIIGLFNAPSEGNMVWGMMGYSEVCDPRALTGMYISKIEIVNDTYFFIIVYDLF